MAVRKRFLQQYMQEENTSGLPADSLNSDSDSDDPVPRRNRKGEKLYCICRRPYDEREFMIGCDGCGNWFHGKCVSVTPSMASNYPKWFCSKCKAAQAGFTPTNPSSSTSGSSSRRRKSAPMRSIKNQPRPVSSPPLVSANGSALSPAPSPVSSVPGDSKDRLAQSSTPPSADRAAPVAETGSAASSISSPALPVAAVKTEPVVTSTTAGSAPFSASSTSSTSTSAAPALPDSTSADACASASASGSASTSTSTSASTSATSSNAKLESCGSSSNGLRLPKKKYLASSVDSLTQAPSKVTREGSVKSDTEPAPMEVSSPSQNEDKPQGPTLAPEPKKRGRKRKNSLPPQAPTGDSQEKDSKKPTTRSVKEISAKDEEEEAGEEKKPAASPIKESERDRRAREREKQREIERQRSKEEAEEASQESVAEDKKATEKRSRSPKRGRKRKEIESKEERKEKAKPSPSTSPRKQTKKEKDAKEAEEKEKDTKEAKEDAKAAEKKSSKEKKDEKPKGDDSAKDTSKDPKFETKMVGTVLRCVQDEERKEKRGPKTGKRRKSAPVADSFLVENGEIAPRRAKLAAYFPEDYQKPLVPEKKPPPSESDSSSESSEDESAAQDGPKDTRPVYCVCKRPYDNRAFMIQCTRCKDWFHGTCIGISWQEAKKIKAKTQKFSCPNCSSSSKSSRK